jgi:DNA-binding MarR family transcriptional regulator
LVLLYSANAQARCALKAEHNCSQVRVRLTPKGRSVRERAFAFRSDLVKGMGLSPADFQHLREQMVKLRANLLDAVRENR